MSLEQQEKENRKKFFARLRGRVTKQELKLISDAYNIAKAGHRKQFRDDGTRYFEHCRQSALILMDELGIYDAEMIEAALLHDMLEDSLLVTSGGIASQFGERVMQFVVILTKPKKSCAMFKSDRDRHQYYFLKLKNAPLDAKIIKLCDRLHNMRTLHLCKPEKRERKIKETREVYLPLIDDLATSSDFKMQNYASILSGMFSVILSQLEQE